MNWWKFALSCLCYLALLVASAWCIKEALVVSARWAGL